MSSRIGGSKVSENGGGNKKGPLANMVTYEGPMDSPLSCVIKSFDVLTFTFSIS